MEAPHQVRIEGNLAAMIAVAAQRDLLGFNDFGRSVTSFLYDADRWTVEEACYKGLPRLVCHLMAYGMGYRTHPTYVAYLFNKRITRWAAAGDLQSIIDFDRCLPRIVITLAVVAAAGKGHAEVLDWLRARGPLVVWPSTAFARAAMQGQLQILQWFGAHGFDIADDPMLLESAVDGKIDEITRYLWPLYESRENCASLLSSVASFASLHMAQWIIANITTRVTVCIDKAAERGDINFLRWALGLGATATTRAMDDAAAQGHLDVLIWLNKERTEGCTSAAVDQAAANGHLRIVKWLATNRPEGCTNQALFNAASTGRPDILELLLEMWPSAIVPPTAFYHICAGGHIEVAPFLTARDIGGGSHLAMDWAAGNNHIGVLEFLRLARQEGCTAAAMNRATANGSLGALEWLQTHRQEGCTTSVMGLAAGNGQYDAIGWLTDHRSEGCSGRAQIYRAAAFITSPGRQVHRLLSSCALELKRLGSGSPPMEVGALGLRLLNLPRRSNGTPQTDEPPI